MSGWTCANCGGGAVQVSSARPSLDERFAVGLCEHCSRYAKPTGRPRPEGLDPSKPQQLVRDAAVADRLLTERRERQRDHRILARPRNDAEHEQRSALLARYEAEARERNGS